MTTRPDGLTLDDQLELSRLVIEFGWRTDNGQAAGRFELFTADGAIELDWAQPGQTPIAARGREELIDWAQSRASDARRVCHVLTNLRFNSIGPDAAEGTSITSVYKDIAGSPCPTSPMVITRFHDRFARVDGQWLFASRKGELLFGSLG